MNQIWRPFTQICGRPPDALVSKNWSPGRSPTGEQVLRPSEEVTGSRKDDHTETILMDSELGPG